MTSDLNSESQAHTTQEQALLAGGCFWCVEAAYHDVPGVLSAVSGYTGDSEANADYDKVAYGKTKHREVVRVTYNPSTITYREVLNIFWKIIDPTQTDGQFADRGEHYKTAIFYYNESQQKTAEDTKKEIADSGKFRDPIVTEILPAGAFFPAEDHHQDYYLKNPEHYKRYSIGSGRKGFVEKTWGK